MDKSLLIFIAVGIGFLYFITNFIGDIQEKEDRYANEDYKIAHQYNQYNSVDSIGQEILVVTEADEITQIAVWQASELKKDFLQLFPDYSEMKKFVKNRTRGDALQKKLLHKINEVEGKFFSGTLNAEQAKQSLDSLK
jgi:hypothetical protein